MPREFYTPEQLAELLQVSKPAIYKWAQEGRIKAVRIGRTVRIPAAEVERLVRGSDKPTEEQPGNKYSPALVAA
jgi:excisionase family DNA binding protein